MSEKARLPSITNMADEAVMEQNNNNLLVAQTLASSIKSLLGPHHSLKCCTSDGEVVICSNTAKLLQFIDVHHPAGFVINDACQGHYKKYRTNCTTLVCLAGFWSRAAQYLQEQGVPAPVIVHLFDEAMEACEKVFEEICFSVFETLHVIVAQENYPITSENKTVGIPTDLISHNAESSTEERSCLDEGDSSVSEQCDDVSWYFDGHAQGAPSMESSFSAVLPLNDLPALGNDTEIKGLDPKTSSSRHNGDHEENLEATRNMLSKAENDSLTIDFEDLSIRESSGLTHTGVNIEARDMFKSALQVDQKADKIGFESAVKSSPRDAQQRLNSVKTVSKLLLNNTSVLRSDEEDEDEFEVCFSDAFSISAEETLKEPSVAKKREEIVNHFEISAPGRNDVDDYKGNEKRSGKKGNLGDAFPNLKTPKLINRRLMNPTGFVSCTEKEKEITDKMLCYLAERQGVTHKGSTQQVKYSEVYKGSRHLANTSFEADISMSSSSEVSFDKEHKQTNLEMPCEETSYGKPTHGRQLSQTSSTSKTGLTQSTFRTNTGLTHSSRHEKTTSMKHAEDTSSKSQINEKVVHRNRELLPALGCRLSHGKEQEMKLAVEVINTLFEASGQTSLENFEIHPRMIHSQMILGPPTSFSQNINGLLIECSVVFHSVISRTEPGTEFIVALVDGDITPEFRHPGLNQETPILSVLKFKDFESGESDQVWRENVIRVLSCHKIGALMVKGVVDESVLDYCLSQGVVLLQHVSYPCLQMTSYATDTAIVSYLTDQRESDIGRPVTMETWELGWTPSRLRRNKNKDGGGDVTGIDTCHYVVVKERCGDKLSENADDVKSSLQTVLLCSPCRDLLCDMEERFWNVVFRLKNALTHGRVLPGAGACEIACARRLDELANDKHKAEVLIRRPSSWLKQDIGVFRPVVYREFAQGIKTFLTNVLHNSGECVTPQQALLSVEELINKGTSKGSIESFQFGKAKSTTSELEIKSDLIPENAGIPKYKPESSAGSPKAGETGFQEHSYSTPLTNSVRSCSVPGFVDSTVWDDYSAKIEAWKRAVSVVRILLQSDWLIETGLEEHRTGRATGLMSDLSLS